MTKLILVEGLPKYEGTSEAKVIADSLDLMKRSLDGRRERHLHITSHLAKNKSDFLYWLAKETDFLHISAHGFRDNQQTYLKITRNTTISAKDISNLNIKAKVIFLNACQQSRTDMANAFLDAGKSTYRYFIAPFNEVPFDEAFVVGLLFYRSAFLGKIPLNNKNKLLKALRYAFKLKDIKSTYNLW